MALKDSSGKITIDEVAAQQDVQKLLRAIEILENAKKAIENLINQAADEKGLTAKAIESKAIEMKNYIVTMINKLRESESFINNTVSHYQEVDRLLKEAIEQARIAAEND